MAARRALPRGWAGAMGGRGGTMRSAHQPPRRRVLLFRCRGEAGRLHSLCVPQVAQLTGVRSGLVLAHLPPPAADTAGAPCGVLAPQ